MTGLTEQRTAELIATLDEYDQMIEDAQSSKREMFAGVREELKGLDKAAIGVIVAELKKAVSVVRTRRNNPEKLQRAEEIVEGAEQMVAAYDRHRASRSAPRANGASLGPSQDAASDYRQAKDAHDPEAHSSHTEGSGDGGHVRSFEGGV